MEKSNYLVFVIDKLSFDNDLEDQEFGKLRDEYK